MDQTTADALVQAVRDVARAEILPRFRALGADDIDVKSHAEDLVTVADRAAEVALTDRVLNLIPDAAVVGEEAVADDPAILQRLHSDGTVVVIDPIDGTWNYAAGLAMFGVILAVRQGGRTVMGLLYDAILDDWQIAIEGQGAWLIRAHGSRTPLNTRATRSRETETGYLPVHMFEGAARRHCHRPRWTTDAPIRCAARFTNTGCWRRARSTGCCRRNPNRGIIWRGS